MDFIVSRPVLLVEDTQDVREALAALLESCRYRVVTASDGLDALDMLRGGLDPCLILLDLHMPVMDGFRFRAEQLKNERIANVPTVVFSGAYDVTQAARLMGVTDYLQKPIDPAQMIRKVEMHRLRS